MRRGSILCLAICLASSPAHSFQECHGNPHLRVLWQKEMIELGGAYFQMKKEPLGDTKMRLVGHGMIFFHNADGGDTLVRNGISTSYSCAEGEGQGGLTKEDVQSYHGSPVGGQSAPAGTGRKRH